MNEARRFLTRQSQQCETSREWISLRLDGELSELEEAMLRRHVAGCGDCRTFEESAELFTTRLRSAPLETLAPVFAAAPHGAGRRRFVGVGAIAAALAASAAVFFAPGLGSSPSSLQLGELGSGTADVTLDAMRAGERARMRLPASIISVRARFIELT
jgi:ferric-dicitrate binding protein FerR (iron transport regulator)